MTDSYQRKGLFSIKERSVTQGHPQHSTEHPSGRHSRITASLTEVQTWPLTTQLNDVAGGHCQPDLLCDSSEGPQQSEAISRAVSLELLSEEHWDPTWVWALPSCDPISLGKAGFLRAITVDLLLILENSLCFALFTISTSQMRRRGSERLSDLPRVLQLGWLRPESIAVLLTRGCIFITCYGPWGTALVWAESDWRAAFCRRRGDSEGVCCGYMSSIGTHSCFLGAVHWGGVADICAAPHSCDCLWSESGGVLSPLQEEFMGTCGCSDLLVLETLFLFNFF